VSRDLTERTGVELVRATLVRDLGWYPREPERPDYGVDLYVECAIEGRPNGRLFGMQIKTGASYFNEEVARGVVFRGDDRHLAYWERHSLPVVLVLVDPRDETIIWTSVDATKVVRSMSGWKIHVSRAQRLDKSAIAPLERLAEADAYELALRKLRSELTWMRHLARGGRVLLEADEWVNKTSGRGEVRLLAEAASGEVEKTVEWLVLAPWQSYETVLPKLFPWASVSVDEWTYESADEDAWALECGIWDSENKEYVGHTVTFAEWRSRQHDGLRPYMENGEIAYWRLELELNHLGRAFVTVDDHLSDVIAAEAE
jgi:hypothetical protein